MLNPKITHKDREKVLNQKGVVLWLTGLPCSGKTTLATELEFLLFHNKLLVYRLDGDEIRKGLNSDLDFSKEGRKENIRRIGEISKLFADAGFIIIVAVISPIKRDRDNVRKILGSGQFVEIFVDCPVEVCSERDVKGHYKRAINGEIIDFTGVSAKYEPPLNPEIHVQTHLNNIEECVDQIYKYLTQNQCVSFATQQ